MRLPPPNIIDPSIPEIAESNTLLECENIPDLDPSLVGECCRCLSPTVGLTQHDLDLALPSEDLPLTQVFGSMLLMNSFHEI